MTPRNFPPADVCSPEDLDAIADLVVRDPRASYDLAGSREHIEALCKRYQALVQEADLVALLLQAGGCDRTQPLAVQAQDLQERHHALERDLARVTNHLDEAQEEIADLKMRIAHRDSHRAALGDLAFDLLADIGSAGTEIRALTGTLDAERNERQAEVLQAEADRQRADEAEARAEQLRHQLEAMAALLDGHEQTLHHNDRIQSALAATCEAVTGKTIEQVNLELDEELAANPDVGPLHHSRDQREQEDSTP